MIKYRIISKKILSDGLSAEDATTALEMYKHINGEKDVDIEKYDDLTQKKVRYGRNPDLH
jgi:hypothetical protein|tara:strand:+ start:314 stop:493 length:180 start_codon:yes stop_codon:yes gene_type:complete